MDDIDGTEGAFGDTYNSSRTCNRRTEELELADEHGNSSERCSLIQRLKRALSFRSKPAPTSECVVTRPATSGTLSELKAARRRLRAESSNKLSRALDIEASAIKAPVTHRPPSGTLSEITPHRKLPQGESAITDGYGVTLPDLPKPDFSVDYSWDCGESEGARAIQGGGSPTTLITLTIASRDYVVKNEPRYPFGQRPKASEHMTMIRSMDIGGGGVFASIALHNSMVNTSNYGRPADYYQRPSERRSLKAKHHLGSA